MSKNMQLLDLVQYNIVDSMQHSHSLADVRCVMHTHPIHACALSITYTPLKLSHMDACMLYQDAASLSNWPGVPAGNHDDKMISALLDNKRAAILAQRGLAAAYTSVEKNV